MLRNIINAGAAHTNNDYVLRNLRVVNTIFTVAGAAALVMAIAFYYFGAMHVALAAAISSCLYFLCIGANAAGFYFFAKLYFSLHLYAHCILNHLYWGFEAGFWLYFLNFTQVAFIFSPRMSRRRLIAICVTVFTALLLAMALLKNGIAFPGRPDAVSASIFFPGNLALSGFVFILAILYLNTQNLRAEEELAVALKSATSADEAKSRFLSNVSHEMRTPLNAISGFSELLMGSLSGITDPATRETFSEKIALMHGASSTMTAIINDILDFERLQAGRIVLLSEKFELRRLISGVVASVNHGRRKSEVVFASSVSETVPENLISDAARISQILMNLLTNAIKFTHQGQVSVECSLDARVSDVAKVRFEVADTGMGIPADALPHIFDRFSSLSASAGLRFGGTGLGLAITRTLVNALGGTISVQSTPNVGTKFTVVLPLRVTSASNIIAGNGLEALSDIRVLVAEDNEVNQLLIQAILEGWKLNATYANDGLQAIERFNSGNYDLVLLDIQMPYMDGFAVAKAIRNDSNAANRAIPIIALTADALHETREKCFEHGMDDVVLKPISLEILHAAIKRAINKMLVFQI